MNLEHLTLLLKFHILNCCSACVGFNIYIYLTKRKTPLILHYNECRRISLFFKNGSDCCFLVLMYLKKWFKDAKRANFPDVQLQSSCLSHLPPKSTFGPPYPNGCTAAWFYVQIYDIFYFFYLESPIKFWLWEIMTFTDVGIHERTDRPYNLWKQAANELFHLSLDIIREV